MIVYSDEGWQGRNWNTAVRQAHRTVRQEQGYAGKIPWRVSFHLRINLCI